MLRYRLFYYAIAGTGQQLEAETDGKTTTIVLQQLLPLTTYRVSVIAEYAAGMGDAMEIDGTTKEGW